MLIDTHSHMYEDVFKEDWEQIIQRSTDAEVTKVLLPNVDTDSIEPLLYICQKHPDMFLPMMGLHPTSVKENWKEELEKIKQVLYSQPFKAVGEIGMDLYWDTTFEAEQREAFITQIGWANDLGLPVSIHARKTTHILIEILKKQIHSEKKGVFHCFSGSLEEAQQIIDLGFYLGIGGVVTFKNSKLGEVLKKTGLEWVVLETDAPYLTPEPYRGKRNECSYTRLVAYKLADIFGISVKEVAEITTRNARQIFNIV